MKNSERMEIWKEIEGSNGECEVSNLGRVEFKISDNLSGIETYRGVIDGKWVMFEYDGKNALLSYKLEPSRVKKGKSHKVKMVVTDACVRCSQCGCLLSWNEYLCGILCAGRTNQ